MTDDDEAIISWGDLEWLVGVVVALGKPDEQEYAISIVECAEDAS